jgi:hypothetical protein
MHTKAFLVTLALAPLFAFADQAVLERLTALGVPPRIERLLDFRDHNMNAEFVQNVYYCKGHAPTDSEACPRKDRIYTTRVVKAVPHDYLVYIDMKKKSTERRFWVINIHDEEHPMVEALRVANGKNSAEGPFAVRFSNIRDSRQTSLGIYLFGPIYNLGGHGPSLRLYGLERSNNNAYIRDIVFHGAAYVEDKWLEKFKAFDFFGILTKKIGESWGCPAVARDAARRLVPLLANGAFLYIDHEDVMDEALTGNPVYVMHHVPTPKVRPDEAPKRIEFQVVHEGQSTAVDTTTKESTAQ